MKALAIAAAVLTAGVADALDVTVRDSAGRAHEFPGARSVVVGSTAVEPPVEPPPVDRCPEPAFPTSIMPLTIGRKVKVALRGGATAAYRFTAADFPRGNGIALVAGAPVAGAPLPSPMTTVALSECPGDISIPQGLAGLRCITAGREPALRFSTAGGGSVCRMPATGPLYLNLSPVNPSTLKPSCDGACGIVLQVN